MRLGLKLHDPAAVEAVPLHYAAELPPPVLDRSGSSFMPGLYENNVLPNCTAVAIANAARGEAWLRTGADLAVRDDAVPAFYARCIGAPADIDTLAASDGVRLLDALGLASSTGFDIGTQTPLVPSWQRCTTASRFNLAHAMAAGAVVLGVNLAIVDQAIGGLWNTGLAASPADQKPGSFGAHALIAWDYTGLGDGDTVRLGTWGFFQRATWRWIDSRITEAYALQFRQVGG